MRKLSILFCIFILAGCATKTQFVYEHPEIPQPSSTGIILGLYSIEDQRGESKEIDKVYGNSPVDSMDQIIEEELKSTGLFEHVFLIPEDKENDKDYLNQTSTSLLVNTTLLKMQWEVPDYDAIVGKAFVTSFLTGGIGGIVYGSTSTDVYGDTSLNINVTDVNSGKSMLNKVYDGHHEEKMAKLQCDTSTTKATMVGKSFKKGLEEFKKDLIHLIRSNDHERLETQEKDNNRLE